MKTLVVISASYPYSVGEDFVYKELKEAKKYYDRILVYPLLKDEHEIREIPDNCTVSDILQNNAHPQMKGMMIRRFGSIIGYYLSELFGSSKPFYVLTHFKAVIASIKQCMVKADILMEDLQKMGVSDAHYYSVWMNDGALIMTMLKRKKRISNFFIRLHGYDLFDERRDGNYMPFRKMNFKNANRVFVLSQAGVDYLKTKNLYPEKLKCNYSGLYDHGVGPFDPEAKFTLLSCSSLNPFKRVDRIVELLKLLDFPIKWVHIGDGAEFENIKSLAAGLPDSVEVQLPGRLSNPEVIKYYQENHVNLFIHLSETEGLGMAAVEAQSFGVPGLSLDVGGVKEVVNDQSGMLLPLETSVEDLAKKVTEFKSSQMNSEAFRKQVREYFLEKFEATKNYRFFYEQIEQYSAL